MRTLLKSLFGARWTLVPIWAWLLAAAAIGAALLPRAVAAADVYRERSPDGWTIELRLAEAPCTDAAVLAVLAAKVPAKLVPLFKAARLLWQGRYWASCWIEVGGRVLSYDAEGAAFNPPYGVPRRLFRDDTI
jgi:hypothetical protein